LKFYAGINNISDREYMVVKGYPADGRTYLAGISWEL